MLALAGSLLIMTVGSIMQGIGTEIAGASSMITIGIGTGIETVTAITTTIAITTTMTTTIVTKIWGQGR